MNCCDVVDPLVVALRALIAQQDNQYLSKDQREVTSNALVAMANAEARVCQQCWKNTEFGNISGTVVFDYVPPDPEPDDGSAT